MSTLPTPGFFRAARAQSATYLVPLMKISTQSSEYYSLQNPLSIKWTLETKWASLKVVQDLDQSLIAVVK